MIMTIVRVVSYFLVFYLGRLSHAWYRNKYLSEKEGELRAYRDALIEMSQQIEDQDAMLRKKWQAMISDISRYEFANEPEELRGIWTTADQMYLESWASAEKKGNE